MDNRKAFSALPRLWTDLMEKWCHPYERYVSQRYTQMARPLFFFLFLSFFFSKIILGKLEKLYPLPDYLSVRREDVNYPGIRIR